jgi:hypothetical protein
MVKPQIVVFSINRRQFNLPRDDVVGAIRKASKDVRFVCTQLPERFHPIIMADPIWSHHRHASGKGHIEGTVELEFAEGGLAIRFRGPEEERCMVTGQEKTANKTGGGDVS